MRKIGVMLVSLAATVASPALCWCTSSLCSGTHTLTNFLAVYTGCQKNDGGSYVTANLQIDCSQTLASGSGTGSDTAAAAHQWVIIDNSTKQAVFTGQL